MIYKRILSFLRPVAPLIDAMFIWITLIGSIWFRILKFWGLKNTPISKWFFFKIGMLPIVNHYYEPFPNIRQININSTNPRKLKSINFNIPYQLDLLNKIHFNDELNQIQIEKGNGYFFKNESFGIGDGEAYYSLIRYLKPKKIIEIGAGYSTLLAEIAINKNIEQSVEDKCELYCIEPYEYEKLENLNINLIKSRAEDVSIEFYAGLGKNDILFIDSSHIIKPNEDVLFEIFEILPILKSGVYIHFHDIFTPYNYPKHWVTEELRLWNEQFLIEGFLSYNDQFEIVLSLAYLKYFHLDKLIAPFPILADNSDITPTSFWIRKR